MNIDYDRLRYKVSDCDSDDVNRDSRCGGGTGEHLCWSRDPYGDIKRPWKSVHFRSHERDYSTYVDQTVNDNTISRNV